MRALLKNIKAGDQFMMLDPITFKPTTGNVLTAKTEALPCVAQHYVYVRCEDGRLINTLKNHPVEIVE